MGIKIKEFRKVSKGNVYGFCSARIDAWHMEINSITVFYTKGQFSFALPSRQYTKQDGTTVYASYIKLDDNAYGRMQVALRNALEEYLRENNMSEELPDQGNLAFKEDEMPF